MKQIKRLFALLTALALACTLAACGETGDPDNPTSSPDSSELVQAVQEAPQQESGDLPSASSAPSASAAPEENATPTDDGQTNVLVAYFSATGNTAGIAATLQTVLDVDLYEIVPEEPYTDEDLNYSSDDCRANWEQNDPDARPALAGTLENPKDYNVVFLGYPIWWGQAPKILYTFLESSDFGGAVIVPFCTSGSSGIGSSAENLHGLAPDARWLDGQRFGAGAGEEEIARWVEGLELPGISGGSAF